jgi:hypothetical protein
MVAAGAPVSLKALTAEGRAAGHNGATGQPGDTSALMTKAMFAAHLNTVFLVRLNEKQTVPLELIALNDSGPARDSKARAEQECFALAFRAPGQRTLKQSTYQLEHSALGRFDLFIAPVRSKKHELVYEAIINHVRA